MTLTSPEKKKEEEDKAFIPLEERLSLEDFAIEQLIGIGNFGKVMLAFNKKKQEYSALKIIQKKSIENIQYSNHLLTELKVMHYLKDIHCPSIVKIKSQF